MKKGDRFYLIAAYVLSLWTLIVVGIFVFQGQPLRHCRYLVPIKSHPGIYSCSEYPRPLAKP